MLHGIIMLGLLSSLYGESGRSFQCPLLTDERVELMKAYSLRHYGVATASLEEPRMIVIHYTENTDFKYTLKLFSSARITKRPDLAPHGAVNTGAHYLVKPDGSWCMPIPLTHMARHTIGFNHTAIGIENVASGAGALTAAQLETNAALVAGLVRSNPAIEFMIGHHEYENATLPHYALRRELDETYRPTRKTDPGDAFMKKLRALLAERYNINLKD